MKEKDLVEYIGKYVSFRFRRYGQEWDYHDTVKFDKIESNKAIFLTENFHGDICIMPLSKIVSITLK